MEYLTIKIVLGLLLFFIISICFHFLLRKFIPVNEVKGKEISTNDFLNFKPNDLLKLPAKNIIILALLFMLYLSILVCLAFGIYVNFKEGVNKIEQTKQEEILNTFEKTAGNNLVIEKGYDIKPPVSIEKNSKYTKYEITKVIKEQPNYFYVLLTNVKDSKDIKLFKYKNSYNKDDKLLDIYVPNKEYFLLLNYVYVDLENKSITSDESKKDYSEYGKQFDKENIK